MIEEALPESPHSPAIASLTKIVQRCIYRNFMKQLISIFIKSLKEQSKGRMHRDQSAKTDYQVKEQQKMSQEWIFSALLRKRNKTEEDELMLEFINLCATKIQSGFKQFIHTKRHREALRRVKNIQAKLTAILKGWKTRKIYNCLKIKQIRRKREQIIVELQHQLSSDQNKKKIDYLKKNMNSITKTFFFQFQEYYESGHWVFEVDRTFKRIRPKRIIHKIPQTHQTQIYTMNDDVAQNIKAQPIPSKTKRVRQFRKQPTDKSLSNANESNQIVNNIDQNSKISTNSSFPTGGSQDRPIKAKGAYSIEEEIKGQQNIEVNEIDKQEIRRVQKKKMEKRQMYDPKKAIQQAKLKKKEKESSEVATKIQQIVEEKNIKSKVDSLNDKNDNKSIEKTIPNKSALVTKTKIKTESKIDCWGSKKNIKKQDHQKSFTKSIDEVKQNKSEVVTYEKIHLKGQPKAKDKYYQTKQRQREVKERKFKEREMELQLQRIQIAKEEQAQRRQFENKKRNNTINYQVFMKNHEQQSKHGKYPNLKQKYQKIVDKRKQMYRSVQELESAYDNQYVARLNNLIPKLNMLQRIRKSDSSSSIPIISTSHPLISRIIKDYPDHKIFWKKMSDLDTPYKQFIQL